MANFKQNAAQVKRRKEKRPWIARKQERGLETKYGDFGI
jgi:hypothetical protein